MWDAVTNVQFLNHRSLTHVTVEELEGLGRVGQTGFLRMHASPIGGQWCERVF